MRASFTRAIAVGCALCCLSARGLAGSALSGSARPFAEHFLALLDSGEVSQAYELIDPQVRSSLALTRLSQLRADRGTRGYIQRKFVHIAPTLPVRSALGMTPYTSSVVVCFVENPTVNFRGVSYTAVTVSGNVPGKMQIENFQTTSVPVTACR
jgi:hypothetical protein